ncbi:MAG: acyltransferase family protein [Sedimentisphaerales bacterium]|jgi:fucose 4-O-acetylase-like acetyltransferase|nr:acyltransferase family protein [Sedimentisphaerales bacterium]
MAKSRLLFVDNLRTLVIVLVILVHLSITYGGEGGWYYNEGPKGTISSILLTWFNAACQSFFMGLLFLLSAYFTAEAYARKGPRRYARDRLLRLGIPLLVYDWVLHPLSVCSLMSVGVYGPEASCRGWLGEYFSAFHLGRGPLWFVETLLFFGLVYLLWQRLTASRTKSAPRPVRHPTAKHILILALLLAIASFIVRLWFPLGWSLEPFNVQLCFFPQYVAMFALGIHAHHHGWLLTIPTKTGQRWGAVAAAMVLLGFPLLFVLGGAMSEDLAPFMGGVHWQSLALAMWEQTTGIAIMVALLVLFRERFDRQGRIAAEASASSYTVYVIHAPVIILGALAVRSVVLYPLVKFALVSLVLIPLCFLLAAGIRRLPGARRIL